MDKEQNLNERSSSHQCKRRRTEEGREASQHARSSAAEQQEVTFVYRGQPIEEIPGNITHVEIDASVQKIGDQAFKDCRLLRSITIPSTVKAIGAEAFSGCVSLTNVHLHVGLKTIGTSAFYNCSSLEEVELPNGITEIADSTFCRCEALCTVSVPITVVTIGAGAFHLCISLVDLTLPKKLTRIGALAFKGCTTLSSVRFPPSLEFVGTSAFGNCRSLLSVEFPSKSAANIKIGMFCFCGTQSLVTVSIPRGYGVLNYFSGSAIRGDKIVACLEGRFSNHPVHALCYNSSVATRDQMMRILDESSNSILDDSSLKDGIFEMTPFHILSSSASLNPEILQCLLDRYPMDILGCKDSFGNTMMDYLLKHTSPRSVPLLQMVLRQAIVNTVSTWYPKGNWGTNLSRLVESIPVNSDVEGRRQCVKDVFGHAGYCIRVEMISLVELAVWKTKMMREDDGKESSSIEVVDDMERDSYRYQSDGAGIVIENIIGHLWWEGESTLGTALSVFRPFSSSAIFESRDQHE